MALLLLLLGGCNKKATPQKPVEKPVPATVIEPIVLPVADEVFPIEDTPAYLVIGAARFRMYLPQLKNKSVGMIVNHSSMVGNTHLVDTLLARGVNVTKIFAPEHGFRGMADAGETVVNNLDTRTGLPVVSLYGDKKKPGAEEMEGLDVIIFDIQDVGVRFYTYISTMSLAMEACAEYGIPMIVLDRPNPNGHYVDGPVLDMAYSSFVGMHPIPVVHGMTVGEYARMVNGEGWLAGGVACDLTVVNCLNYTHDSIYNLPVKPSPNLPDMKSIYLYPSLCFFEGTVLSVGRGTDKPFQIFGAPEYAGEFPDAFMPLSKPGAKNPPRLGELCYGKDLSIFEPLQLRNVGFNLAWLIEMYECFPNPDTYFTDYLTKLAGSPALAQQIRDGVPLSEIRASWEPALGDYKVMRKKYLLYK